MREMPQTILILDNDLGFLALICLTLTHAGYLAVPSSASDRAVPLLKEMNAPEVNLLIVNLSLPSTSNLARNLRKCNPLLKIIAIDEAHTSTLTELRISARLRKPGSAERVQERAWLRLVEWVLECEEPQSGDGFPVRGGQSGP